MRTALEFFRRLMSSVRPSRSDADMEEELRAHLELAAEDARRRGLPAEDASRAARLRAGSVSQAMDGLRDQRSLPSLDAIAFDIIFGWRQLLKHRTATLSAVLSLGLAMGATLAALRLVDAVLLRPLPIADPSRLFAIAMTRQDVDGRPDERDDFDYPTFRRYTAAAEGKADLLLIGMAVRRPIQIDGGEPEPAVQQFVSGNVFPAFGLQPALGRLISPADDVTPNGHPIAVISHDFWQRRFAGDPAVIGRTFRIGARVIEIVGVAPAGFTGTQPGAFTDFFIPSMMNPDALDRVGWSWFRIWARPKTGIDAEPVQAVLQARFHADQVARAKTLPADTPQSQIDAVLAQQLLLRPASAGVSDLQKSFKRPLWILAALAVLLLLVACTNVANLLLARAMSRRTEMALRVSIGASRARLFQLMLIESALLALAASAVAALFASWAAPFIVSMLAPENRPVRLVLDLDWRTLGLGAATTLAVTMVFGLAPALRASAVDPIGALKEARAERAQRRMTDVLVTAQMAFCMFLLFGANLFLGTLDRLQNKPLGFDPDDLVHIMMESRTELAPDAWRQLAAGLGEIPRVESAAITAWAPLTGNRWRFSVTVGGRSSEPSPNWVSVSPEYFETMGMRLLEGRAFRPDDMPPGPGRRPGVAIVNQAFARAYLGGKSPVGQHIINDSSGARIAIVGMVADAVYYSVRETMHPGLFVPLAPRSDATLMIRTEPGAADLVSRFGRDVTRVRPDVRVHDVAPYRAFVTQQMIRERLLAALSIFFAVLALIVAVIGLYGVLNYAVTRERREIGLRLALGARPRHVMTLVTRRLLAMVGAGALAGVGGGLLFGRWVQTLLFDIAPTDPLAWLVPVFALATAAALAVWPPTMRAVRIDPAQTIKSEG